MNNLYIQEVKQRWGNTSAYKEFAQRHTDYKQAAALFDLLFEDFAEMNRNGVSPDDNQAKIQVGKLQQCITDNFYTCTDEILKGLGRMYAADERFKKSIDKHGEGTATFVSACIEQFFQ